MIAHKPIVIDSAGSSQDIEIPTNDGLLVPHIIGCSVAPTITSGGLSLGSTVTLTSNSNDLAGEINITTGLVSIGIGATVTVTFANQLNTAPFTQISPSSTSSRSLSLSAVNYTRSTSSIIFTFTVTLGISSTFSFIYQNIC